MRISNPIATFAAAFIASVATAQDAWIDLTGRDAPPFEASAWLNVDGSAPTVETLRGKVWLLEFTAST